MGSELVWPNHYSEMWCKCHTPPRACWRVRETHFGRALVLCSNHSRRGARAATSASGSFYPRAGSDLPLSLLLTARGVRGSSYEVYVHHVGEARTPRTTKALFLAHQMLKWFYDTSNSTATRPSHYGSFVGDGLGLLYVSYGGIWWR
jgi:hypothetical protein